MALEGSKSPLAAQILMFLLACLPLGPAIHSLGLLLGLLIFIKHYRLSLFSWMASTLRTSQLWYFQLPLLAFVLWNIFASLLNREYPGGELLAYLIGFLPLLLFPWLYAGLPKLSVESKRTFCRFGFVVLLIWALVILSQVLIGWKISGIQLELNTFYRRARGFYSHPLTLAYVALIVWPFALLNGLRRSAAAVLMLASAATLLIFSQSRTAQVLAFLLLVWNGIYLLRGSQRWLVLGFSAVLGLGLLLSDNPISRRFQSTFQSHDADRFSSYPDDRLAFWHVHLLMIKDRPWLGHGIKLDAAYRSPYYEQIGLSDFRKKYDAHNQYLQAATEGGFIGLGLFMAWLVGLTYWIRRSIADPQLRKMGLQALLLFALGGLTQNAFYDAEVRMALLLMLLVLSSLDRLPSAASA